jgi:hypothetical protein
MRILYALFTMACVSASPGKAGSWTAVPSPDNSSDIWYVAADSASLAIQTSNGIWLSGNRGLDWRDLGPNKFPADSQRIHLSHSHLFVSLPESRWLHRYSLVHAVWDSVSLPEFDYRGNPPADAGYIYSPTGLFAASGDEVAFAAVVKGHPTLFLSSDEGGHFDSAGILPFDPEARLGLGMALGRDGIALAQIDQSVSTLRSTDHGLTWKNLYGCGHKSGGFSKSLCYMRSGFYFLEWSGKILAMAEDGSCQDTIPYTPDWSPIFDPAKLKRMHPHLAASGGILYYGIGKSLWILEETPANATLFSRSPQGRSRRSTQAFPVRIWSHPSQGRNPESGVWIDALGARRDD